jgi:hypothetical protein
MTTQEQQKQGTDLIETLALKAWESSNFKEQLIHNPVATIESVIGKNFTVPSNKRIVVEDQTNDSIIYFNIPAEPRLDELELTEEQLEAISGGITPYVLYVAVGFAGAALIDWVRG